MPYPVPPPVPPPVVDVLPPKDFSHPPLTSEGRPTPEVSPDAPISSVKSQVDLSAAPASNSDSNRSRVPTLRRQSASPLPRVQSSPPSAVQAEALGDSVQVGLPSVPVEPVFVIHHQPLNRLNPATSEVPPQPEPVATVAVSEGDRPAQSNSLFRRLSQQIPVESAGSESAPGPDRTVELPHDPLPILSDLAGAKQNESPPTPADEPPDPNRQLLLIPGEGEAPTPPTTPAPAGSSPPTPTDPSGTGEIIELDADRQDYDNLRQVFEAEGNVEMRFRGAVLTSDRLRVNLPNRIAVAEGNVRLVRGVQTILGDRFVYNFVQDEGNVQGARGEVFLPSTNTDLATSPSNQTAGIDPNQPITEVIPAGQPPYSTGGINAGIGASLDQGLALQGQRAGELTRIRFEAEEIDFYPEGWTARNVRLTNDPFSPPELEVRSPQVTLTRLTPFVSELRARNPRLVFDQGLSVPLLRDRAIIDSRERDNNPIATISYDDDLGGLYVQRAFDVLNKPWGSLTVTPLILVQRMVESNSGIFEPTNFGLLTQFDSQITPTTSLTARALFTSLALSDLDNELRASVRLRQQVFGRHQLAFEYSYRDRLFNGSLGFQNVQSNLGVVFSSPVIPLGNTGINLNYQAGIANINADTDFPELLEPDRTNNRVTLGRFQGSVGLSRSFLLWQGTPLPPTPGEGMRYTPNPLVPYISLNTSLRGVYGYYTSDDVQATLTGSIGLQGQFGHSSRDFLDYTGFNITYSGTARDGESPFKFDRVVDDQVLSFGLVQQIYGALRFGFQTSINLERDEPIETDYILEYSRRTYAIVLRFNPEREQGSLNLRISDFNWGGTRDPFGGSSFPSSTGEGAQPPIPANTVESGGQQPLPASTGEGGVQAPNN